MDPIDLFRCRPVPNSNEIESPALSGLFYFHFLLDRRGVASGALNSKAKGERDPERGSGYRGIHVGFLFPITTE